MVPKQLARVGLLVCHDIPRSAAFGREHDLAPEYYSSSVQYPQYPTRRPQDSSSKNKESSSASFLRGHSRWMGQGKIFLP